jgi:hypothetical protein
MLRVWRGALATAVPKPLELDFLSLTHNLDFC